MYDRLDYASAVLALQRSNDSLIHRLQTGGCIWRKKVECDRFKILSIRMGSVIRSPSSSYFAHGIGMECF